jgi:radical SAM protein with 4Fe4S-binding SPASM domain
MDHYKAPIKVNFVITDHCNSHCIFCGVETSCKYRFKDIGHIKRIIDLLAESEVLRINFFGGEPFLYPDLIEAIDYAHNKGIFCTTITNGIGVKEDTIRSLSRYVDNMGVSLHGNRDIHEEMTRVKGSYDKVMQTLELLRRYDIQIGINVTVTKMNYGELVPLFESIHSQFGITDFVLNRYIPNRFIDAHLNEQLIIKQDEINATLVDLERLDEKYPDVYKAYAVHFPHCLVKNEKHKKYVSKCNVGEGYCAIDYDGNIRFCAFSNIILGNIFENRLDDVWNAHELLNEYRSEAWLPSACVTCSDKPRCMAGCKITEESALFSPDILLRDNT